MCLGFKEGVGQTSTKTTWKYSAIQLGGCGQMYLGVMFSIRMKVTSALNSRRSALHAFPCLDALSKLPVTFLVATISGYGATTTPHLLSTPRASTSGSPFLLRTSPCTTWCKIQGQTSSKYPQRQRWGTSVQARGEAGGPGYTCWLKIQVLKVQFRFPWKNQLFRSTRGF